MISAQVNGNRNVPELWDDNGNWNLDLNWWDNDWNSDYRFLAVRNNRRFVPQPRRNLSGLWFLHFLPTASTLSRSMESLARIFGSPARLRILRLFLLNQGVPFTFIEAAARAKVSPSAARSALANLVAAGFLRKRRGTPLRYQVNPRFEHLSALDAFIRQTTNLRSADVIRVLKRSGTLRLVALSGFFTGALEPQIDLLVVGEHLDDRALTAAVATLEAEIGREIRYAAFSTNDFHYRMGVYDRLLRDVFDYPHRLLLAKIGL